jgi:flagellin-like hook-associated protein FlgL
VSGLPVQIASGEHFDLSAPSTNYYVWYNVDGGGGDPSFAGRVGIPVNIASGETAASVAAATAAAVGATGNFNTSTAGATAFVTSVTPGTTTDAQNVNVGGITVSTFSQGVNPDIDLVAKTVTTTNSYATGDQVNLLTTGTLPGGLSLGTPYFLIVVNSSTLKFSNSLANALAGIAIDLTSYGSGIHTILASTASASVSYGNGDGTFRSFTQFTAGPSPSSLAYADLNRDGYGDLVIAEGANQTVSVELGSVGGGFTPVGSYATLGDARGIGLGDFNLDGTLDIVTSIYNGTSPAGVSVLSGNGDGSFNSAFKVDSGSSPDVGPYGISVADVNGDGISDIVASNYNSGSGSSASVILSNGDGTFKAPTIISTGTGPRATSVSDLNGDGVPDIVTANLNANSVSVALAKTTTTNLTPVLNISTQAAALGAMGETSAVLDSLALETAEIGAHQSVLATHVQALSAARSNVEAAASRILDAEVAEETARLVRASIRLKGATSLLAQHESITANLVRSLIVAPIDRFGARRVGVPGPIRRHEGGRRASPDVRHAGTMTRRVER